jgi:hypothetical protein
MTPPDANVPARPVSCLASYALHATKHRTTHRTTPQRHLLAAQAVMSQADTEVQKQESGAAHTSEDQQEDAPAMTERSCYLKPGNESHQNQLPKQEQTESVSSLLVSDSYVGYGSKSDLWGTSPMIRVLHVVHSVNSMQHQLNSGSHHTG